MDIFMVTTTGEFRYAIPPERLKVTVMLDGRSSGVVSMEYVTLSFPVAFIMNVTSLLVPCSIVTLVSEGMSSNSWFESTSTVP